MIKIAEYKNFRRLTADLMDYNKKKGIERQYEDRSPRIIRVIFSNDSKLWERHDYPEEERTYEFRSDEKYFLSKMLGNSIFANALAGPDKEGIRLDWYIWDWQIEKIEVYRK